MYVLQWFCVYLKEHLKVKNILTILISGYANVIALNIWKNVISHFFEYKLIILDNIKWHNENTSCCSMWEGRVTLIEQLLEVILILNFQVW